MKIFITGSADGLGSLAAKKLIADGHEVVLHARDTDRAETAMQQAPGAKKVLVGDLANIEEVKNLAEQANQLHNFDAIIHNAGIYSAPAKQLFTVNSLAPYILTSLMNKPKRLIYLSSGMHKSGSAQIDNIEDGTSYGDTKFQILLLTKAIARKYPDIYSNAVDPGWVPTKMGGTSAPDDLTEGFMTQVWLATSGDEQVKVSGQYFYHRQLANYAKSTDDTALQDKFIEACKQISGLIL